MQRTIVSAVLIGLAAGLLVGVYHNIFTVPVIERAIMLEEQRAAAALPPGAPPPDAEPPLVSLGLQRVGMAIGTGIYGAVLGLIFAGAYGLLRRTLPNASPVLLAIAAGLLGFWAISFVPFIKYPFVPPGVGEGSTLIFRQGFQTLLFILSALGVVGLLLGLNEIRNSIRSETRRQLFYALVAVAYGAFLLLVFALLPGNPDPVNVPADLLLRFNALSIIGHLLMWGLTAAGFAHLLTRRQRVLG